MKRAVLSLSGGMDSSSLLIHLLAKGYEVTALSFNYGQKHSVELERARSLIGYLGAHGRIVTHQVIDLSSMAPLLNSSLVSGGSEVPEGHYEDDNMKATVVPNRNKIFSSIIQAVALSISTRHDCDVKISLGIHSGDHNIYPDCRQEFRDADYEAFLQGNWDAERVTFLTPYLETDKSGILKDGLNSCKELGLCFDDVYSRTLTSYKPLVNEAGESFSDCYSASSVERVEAFINIGVKDPAKYAVVLNGEVTEVTWEFAVKAVESILMEAK